MKKRLRSCLLLVILGLLAHSCIKENDLVFDQIELDDDFSYDLPIPLVDARLTLVDLLKNVPEQNITTDETGLLRLVYQEEITYDFSEHITIPDQRCDLALPSPVSISPNLFTKDSITIPCPAFTANFELGETRAERIDSAKLRALTYNLTLVTQIRHKGSIRLSCPNLLDSEKKPLTVLLPLPGVSSGQTTQMVNIPDAVLKNYYLHLDNTDPQNLHTIRFDCTTVILKDTNIKQNYAADINFTFRFQNFDFEYVYGYFGQYHTGTEENDFDLPVFRQFSMDSLNVEKIYTKIQISNSLGVPIQLKGEIDLQTNEPVEEPEAFRFDQPLNYPKNPSESPATTLFQDSVLALSLTKLPQDIHYSVDALINPENLSTNSNFISSNSMLKMAVSGEIPMRLRVSNLTVSDTINFQGLPENMDIEGIEFFTLKANVHNAFPLDAQVVMYFLNENHEKIDSVNLNKIDAATVNPVDGHVIAPRVMQTEINLNERQIAHLADTRYFLINGVTSTTNHESGTLVGIYENSENEGFLKVMIGCRIKASGKIFTNISELSGRSTQNEK